MKFKSLGLRVLVAVFGAPLIIFLLLHGGLPFVFLILIINLVAQHEFYKLHELKGVLPIKILGALGTVVVTFFIYFYGVEKLWLIIFGFFYLILLVELFRNNESATLNISSTIFGLFYPTIFFSFLILIRELPDELGIDYSAGGRWLVLMIITIWICDTAAYFIGKAIGRRKLFSRVSPNKTVEGAIAGVGFSFLTVYIFHLTYIKTLTLMECLGVGLIVAIFAQVGDLIESLFKRDVGVKDSSNLLPGHGGMLDRFDAPLFVAPLIYVYLKFLVFV